MPAIAHLIVTLPTALVEQIDRIEPTRNRFIVAAVKHELTRRRDAFLLSVQNPHRDTAAFVDTEVGGWMSNLPGGEALVDVSAGTPVRWMAGQGWTTE